MPVSHRQEISTRILPLKRKKDGYVQIANSFEETANNEKEHAKIWFKLLEGIGTTAENLLSAAEGENYEWTDMYATFAKEAKEEAIYSNRGFV